MYISHINDIVDSKNIFEIDECNTLQNFQVGKSFILQKSFGNGLTTMFQGKLKCCTKLS